MDLTWPCRVYFKALKGKTASEYANLGALNPRVILHNSKTGDVFYVCTVPTATVMKDIEVLCDGKPEREALMFVKNARA